MAIDSAQSLYHPDTNAMLDAIEKKSLDHIAYYLGNTFERALGFDKIFKIKNIMLENWAMGCCMSGSGSAVFGIFDDKYNAEKCRDILAAKHNSVFICHPCSNGVIL